MSLIKAHALLHRSTRARNPEGRIVATVDDYRVVYDLVAQLFAEGIEATVPPPVRETVEAVQALGQPEVSSASLAKHLGLAKATVSARIQKAVARGFLVNHKDKKGMPDRIALGDPLPEERQVLPDPEVFGGDRSGVRSEIGGIRQDVESTDEASPSEDEKPEKSTEISQESTAEAGKWHDLSQGDHTRGLAAPAISSGPDDDVFDIGWGRK